MIYVAYVAAAAAVVVHVVTATIVAFTYDWSQPCAALSRNGGGDDRLVDAIWRTFVWAGRRRNIVNNPTTDPLSLPQNPSDSILVHLYRNAHRIAKHAQRNVRRYIQYMRVCRNTFTSSATACKTLY